MQFIHKQPIEPNEWDGWLTVPPNRRTFDYAMDRSALPEIGFARRYLIEEQYSLCAYCQQKINFDNSSIEHVIPKEYNKVLSTSYFNLVVVCNKNQIKDPVSGKYHCDRARGSKLIPSIIFYSNAQSSAAKTNQFFAVYSDGTVKANKNLPESIKCQVDSFIEVLNLNHINLKDTRAKGVLRGLFEAYNMMVTKEQKRSFWRIQYQRILNDKSHPYREYLLIFIGSKIGL